MKVLILEEERRECGYRKPGADGVGIYLIGGKPVELCERLPFPLSICPCCGSGIKFSRSWTTIEPGKLLLPDIPPVCTCRVANLHGGICPICNPPQGKHGLLWVGKRHYTPEKFINEAQERGISRKIASIPRNLVIGQTVVYLAHKAAIVPTPVFGYGEQEPAPGIITAFWPTHIDLVIDDPDNIPARALNIAQALGEENCRIVKINPICKDHNLIMEQR